PFCEPAWPQPFNLLQAEFLPSFERNGGGCRCFITASIRFRFVVVPVRVRLSILFARGSYFGVVVVKPRHGAPPEAAAGRRQTPVEPSGQALPDATATAPRGQASDCPRAGRLEARYQQEQRPRQPRCRC